MFSRGRCPTTAVCHPCPATATLLWFEGFRDLFLQFSSLRFIHTGELTSAGVCFPFRKRAGASQPFRSQRFPCTCSLQHGQCCKATQTENETHIKGRRSPQKHRHPESIAADPFYVQKTSPRQAPSEQSTSSFLGSIQPV